MSANSSTVGQLLLQGPVCIGWKQEMEGSLYHLANCILLLGFMGGSGVFGCFYVFGFLGTGFLCCVLWGWFHACGLDIILWNFLLAVACLLQLGHLVYLLRKDTLPEEFRSLYRTLYLPLQVPLQAYKEIVHCCKEQVLTLVTEQTYAVEGETPINRLSLLLSGRVRVSQDGQFLHYIFPYQFMDSPEWESLQPSEEGIFQPPGYRCYHDAKLTSLGRRPHQCVLESHFPRALPHKAKREAGWEYGLTCQRPCSVKKQLQKPDLPPSVPHNDPGSILPEG